MSITNNYKALRFFHDIIISYRLVLVIFEVFIAGLVSCLSKQTIYICAGLAPIVTLSNAA